MEIEHTLFLRLAVALAIGLLIGIERGWQDRGASEGERVAGLRTFSLIGLLGGVTGLLGRELGSVLIGFFFLGLVGMLTAVYIVNLKRHKDAGITSEIAALLTFTFGLLAGLHQLGIAAACAVVTALLLSHKGVLHRWLGALQGNELTAGIQLLLMSVVLLPLLPNRGFGPWKTLNPYVIWWMVVLIAAISFVGYFAIRVGGARRGAVFAGLFGGLASSTAVTLHFSRLASRKPVLASALAGGTLLACGTMFPRMLFVAGAIHPPLFKPLLIPVLMMSVLTYAPVVLYLFKSQSVKEEAGETLRNPLELKSALIFGGLLAGVMLVGKALTEWFGDAGAWALAAASGVADVDAITLSLTRMSQQELPVSVAVTGIMIAAAVNSVVKGGMALIIGGQAIGWRVFLPLATAAMAGVLVTVWWIPYLFP